MRRFALSTLRDFGMGKKLSEEKIIQETRYLREVFETFQGNPFDTNQPVNYAVSNIISAIVYGNRFEYDDPKFNEMVDRANQFILMLGSASIQIYNMFPVLRPWLKTWRLLMECLEKYHAEIQVLVDRLRETFNPLDCRGLVDAFFIQKQSLEKSGENNSQFNDLNLLMIVSNLFAAGTDTTGTTLRWGLLLMAKYPHIQDRVHEEIDRVLDRREPVTEDRKNLPYTDAVIHEIQRLANLVPLNLPHQTSCDVNFNGYLIKKGTCVLPLLTSVLRDESEWETPDTFNPEHFLNENGQLIKHDAFMPFSAGRRICLGEGLARMELFLFFTSLLQCFHFTPPPGVSEDELDLTPVVGLVLNPSPHKLCAVSRVEKQKVCRRAWRSLIGQFDQEEEYKKGIRNTGREVEFQQILRFTMALVETLLLNVSSTGALLAALLLLLVIYFCFRSPEDDQEPPGPKPLPLVGNLHILDLKQLHLSLLNLSKKYGSVFKIHLGPKKIVVLAGYKTVKQALVNQADEFGERDITPIFQDISKGHGIAFTNGDRWKTMRRFALSTLRDFGMGKKLSEEKIIQETRYLREVFETFQGNPFDTNQPVNYAVSNIISAIVCGNRFEYEDPKFNEMVDRANQIIHISGSAAIQIYNLFPVLRPWLKTWRLLMESLDKYYAEMQVLVDRLRETFNPLDCRGLVDAFLIQKQSLEKSGENDSQFNDLNLLMTVSNLFAAGTDTTGTTLRWGLLLMAKYPQIQDRVHEEIDRVLDGREPVTEDRKNLPYTDAVIHEIQRLANLVPLNLPHQTSCDVNFNGYLIKKGTCVLPLLTSVLRDESEWKTPDTFNPEHFLNENGQLIKRDAFMPFSAGRRICLGEGLARMELFLFFTSLLQCFHFTPPPGVSEDELDLTPVVGFVLNPSPHKLCAVSRVEKRKITS
nr:cytochrome P450 2K1-like [Misgurnus anguillicaudatus]